MTGKPFPELGVNLVAFQFSVSHYCLLSDIPGSFDHCFPESSFDEEVQEKKRHNQPQKFSAGYNNQPVYSIGQSPTGKGSQTGSLQFFINGDMAEVKLFFIDRIFQGNTWSVRA